MERRQCLAETTKSFKPVRPPEVCDCLILISTFFWSLNQQSVDATVLQKPPNQGRHQWKHLKFVWRPRFFRSLKGSGKTHTQLPKATSAEAASRVEATPSFDRKSFFRSLVKKEPEVPNNEPQDEGVSVTVNFTLESVIAFQHSSRVHDDLASAKKEAGEKDHMHHKRPNYNSHKRRFFAKGRHHEEHLNSTQKLSSHCTCELTTDWFTCICRPSCWHVFCQGMVRMVFRQIGYDGWKV